MSKPDWKIHDCTLYSSAFSSAIWMMKADEIPYARERILNHFKHMPKVQEAYMALIDAIVSTKEEQ
jgi:hypothetical protein